jgi:protein quaking
MTAKQLEQETGCKVMVRGRGSMRDKRRNIDYGPEDMLARNGARSWPLTSCIAPRVAHLFMESCVSYGANCVSSNRAAWDHLNDELHVLITCEDTDNRAQIKLNRAVSEVKKLLIPAVRGVCVQLGLHAFRRRVKTN